MAYKIVKTDSYQRDLDGVVGYIALSLVNKTAAVSLLDAVEKVYDDLERMPLMFGFCDDPHLRDLKYHNRKCFASSVNRQRDAKAVLEILAYVVSRPVLLKCRISLPGN